MAARDTPVVVQAASQGNCAISATIRSDRAAGVALAVQPLPTVNRIPLISVVVPVFNDEARLAGCLDALAMQTWPASHREVIVVDNGSVPPVALRAGAARVIVERRPGSYAARNAGVAAAAGEILAFTDADC